MVKDFCRLLISADPNTVHLHFYVAQQELSSHGLSHHKQAWLIWLAALWFCSKSCRTWNRAKPSCNRKQEEPLDSSTSVCSTCRYLREQSKGLKTTGVFWRNVFVGALQSMKQTGSYKGRTHRGKQLITAVSHIFTVWLKQSSISKQKRDNLD